MNNTHNNGGSRKPLYLSLKFASFDVNWAGSIPGVVGLCFGSDDGRLLFTDFEGRFAPSVPCGQLVMSNPAQMSRSEEAINSVASVGSWFGASTRADVVLREAPTKVATTSTKVVTVPHGAHGLATTQSGYFIAPMGISGIMYVNPDTSESIKIAGADGLYFYAVVPVATTADGDLVAFACRNEGLSFGICRWDKGAFSLNRFFYENLDIIDVFAFTTDRHHHIGAVATDGTLVFVRDVLGECKAMESKFCKVLGTAYRVLTCRGHVFLLTSTGLYVLLYLADRFVEDATKQKVPTIFLVVEMEAIDANIVDDKWLLVVTPDEVRRFDIHQIELDAPEYLEHGEMKNFDVIPLSLQHRKQSMQMTMTLAQ